MFDDKEQVIQNRVKSKTLKEEIRFKLKSSLHYFFHSWYFLEELFTNDPGELLSPSTPPERTSYEKKQSRKSKIFEDIYELGKTIGKVKK